MTVVEPSPSPLPRLSLPVAHRRTAPSALVSLCVHGAILGLVLWQGTLAARRPPGGPGGEGEGAPGGRQGVNFFALPAPAPAALDIPVPALPLTTLPALAQIKVDVPALAPAVIAAPTVVAGGGTAAGQGPGGGGAGGAGTGAGTTPGTGTGGAGDYIVLASPRKAILPPLAKVPGSVAGRAYRIRFWVAADGRVTRVEIDPPIRDDAYRRGFLESMMAYQFYPAHTRDGASIASIYTISMQIGN